MQNRKIVFISLCLMILCACSPPIAVKEVEVQKQYPPRTLLTETPEPVLAGNTWADLANWAADLVAALRSANADKASILEWASAPEVKPVEKSWWHFWSD